MQVQVKLFNLQHQQVGNLTKLASVQRSYVLNGIGQANLVISAKDPMYQQGILDVGKLIVFNSSESVDPWAGWVIRSVEQLNQVTITCKSLAYIFTKRRLGKSEFLPYSTPAEFAKQLTALTNPFIIAAGGNVDTNQPLSKEFHFTGGSSALRRLPYDTGVDWWIDVQSNGVGILVTGSKGTDKSQTVLMAEGNNIAADPSPSYTRDGEELINDAVFVGRGDGAWESAPHAETQDHRAISQWGLYQGTAVRYDTTHSSSLSEIARQQLERKAKPRELIELYLANINGIWSQFVVGDTVTVRIPSLGQSLSSEGAVSGPMRVVAVEMDELSGTPCRIMGEMI